MSRGHVVATLSGDEVTEERMIRAAVASTTLKKEDQERQARSARSSSLRRKLEGDYAPVAILAAVMVGLGGLHLLARTTATSCRSTSPP